MCVKKFPLVAFVRLGNEWYKTQKTSGFNVLSVFQHKHELQVPYDTAVVKRYRCVVKFWYIFLLFIGIVGFDGICFLLTVIHKNTDYKKHQLHQILSTFRLFLSNRSDMIPRRQAKNLIHSHVYVAHTHFFGWHKGTKNERNKTRIIYKRKYMLHHI